MNKLSIIPAVLVLAVSCGRNDSGSNSSRTVIQNKGSDTLVNVAQAWAEAYAKVDADVAIAVTGGGSGTGISAMINGTVDIANASRKMKDEEISQAKQNDIEPVEHVVGHDALAVFVHEDNPLDEVTIAQLATIYGEDGATEKRPPGRAHRDHGHVRDPRASGDRGLHRRTLRLAGC